MQAGGTLEKWNQLVDREPVKNAELEFIRRTFQPKV
jgi:hypothetical protein